MSVSIISDHIIMLRQNFNPQHIDQVKPKSEGGIQPHSPPPRSAPGDNNSFTPS